MHVHLATPSAKAMWGTYLLLIAPLCFSHFQDISVKFLASPPVDSSALGKLQPEASIAAADFPCCFLISLLLLLTVLYLGFSYFAPNEVSPFLQWNYFSQPALSLKSIPNNLQEGVGVGGVQARTPQTPNVIGFHKYTLLNLTAFVWTLRWLFLRIVFSFIVVLRGVDLLISTLSRNLSGFVLKEKNQFGLK